jgi:hypothetical protein
MGCVCEKPEEKIICFSNPILDELPRIELIKTRQQVKDDEIRNVYKTELRRRL